MLFIYLQVLRSNTLLSLCNEFDYSKPCMSRSSRDWKKCFDLRELRLLRIKLIFFRLIHTATMYVYVCIESCPTCSCTCCSKLNMEFVFVCIHEFYRSIFVCKFIGFPLIEQLKNPCRKSENMCAFVFCWCVNSVYPSLIIAATRFQTENSVERMSAQCLHICCVCRHCGQTISQLRSLVPFSEI